MLKKCNRKIYKLYRFLTYTYKKKTMIFELVDELQGG